MKPTSLLRFQYVLLYSIVEYVA